MADDWSEFPAASSGDHDWSEFPEAGATPKPSALEKAIEPITSLPSTYQGMVDESVSQMGHGVGQIETGEPMNVAKGVGNVALGGLGYLTSPISAPMRTIVGKPLKENFGIPEEYSELAASFLLPGSGIKQAASEIGRLTGIDRAIKPLTEAGRKTIAGQVLATRSADADALRASLEDQPHEIVPGSQPTTFQLTGDMGIGALEREVTTKNPQEFMQHRAEQNAARTEQLANLQITGNPQDVADTVRGRLTDIDRMTQAAVDDRLGEAQARADSLGGVHNQEVYGNSLRTILQDAEDTARGHERSLWNAVDPDGDLTVNMAPIRNVAQNFYGGLSQAAQATLKPAEQQILGVIGQYNPVEPFRELTDLRSLVSSEMRQELSANGRTPTYGRLAQLRGGIEDSINSAVGNRAIADAVNVAAGKVAPEQSLAVNLQRQVDQWRSGRQDAAADLGQVAAGRTATMPPVSGGPSPPRGGPPSPAGDTGLQAPPVTANFDQAAAERLRAASAATKERAQAFGAEPLKGILRRQGAQGPYNLRETAVPGRIFHPGDTGFEDVTRFRNAVGDAAAIPVLEDYAASSLREAALTPEGMIDPAKFAKWQAQHAEAMRALPELSGRFADAATASEAVADAARLQTDAMQRAQQDVLGRILKTSNPQDVTRNIAAIFGSKNAIGDMRRLVAQIRNDPDAMDGLRKSIADYINQRFMSNTEASTSGIPLIRSDQFQSFVKNNERALSLVFSPEQIGSMKAIADDLQRANRSTVAVKLPGQSNTAQDLASLAANKNGQSLLRRLLTEGAASGVGLAISHNPVIAAAIGVGAHIINAFRSAGFKNVDDLVKRAMLDPAFAKVLLSKAPTSNPQTSNNIARRIMMLSAVSQKNQEKRYGGRVKERAQGGSIADSCAEPNGDIPEHQQLSEWQSSSPAIGSNDPIGVSRDQEDIEQIPQRAEGGRVELPEGFTAEYAPDPMDRWGIFDKDGALHATGKTKDEAIAALTPKRAHGGRVERRNIDHAPTEAQKAAGNYRKDHVNWNGLNLTIENARGSYRGGVGKDGKPWAVCMPCHYGYVKKSEGADGDHLDIFLGPHDKAPNVFIIDQHDAETGKFDEHKALLNFGSAKQAQAFYHKSFSDGRGAKRLRHITTMTIPQFKDWVKNYDTTKPLGKIAA